jgi:hypothetical protein
MNENDMIELANAMARALPRLNAHGEPTPPKIKNTAIAILKQKADRLGLLHAVIAQSKTEADKLRAELEAAGLDAIQGDLYRVAFAECKGSTRTDWKAVAAKLKPSRQLVAAHTSTGEASTRMTVTARPTN